MTQIYCNIQDSGSQPLVGFIRVTADYAITETNDGSTIVPAYKDTALVNGVCTLDLEPSDRAQVTYDFQVWQSNGTTEGIVWQFKAKVPASIAPINIQALAPTGLTHDAQDSSVTTVVRRILADESFWDRLRSSALKFKGEFDPDAYYRRGDCVVWQGSSYIMIHDGILRNSYPNNPTNWLMFAAKGEVATNLQGDDSPYNYDLWAFDQASPTKNTLRNIINQLAFTHGSYLYDTKIHLLEMSDYSQQAVYSKWVKDHLSALRAAILGDINNGDMVIHGQLNEIRNTATANLNTLNASINSRSNQARDEAFDRLPAVFKTGNLLFGSSLNLNANEWVTVYRQFIDIKPRGSHSVHVNAHLGLTKAVSGAIANRMRINLIPHFSDIVSNTLVANKQVSQSHSHIFSNIPTGTQTVELQINPEEGGAFNIQYAQLWTTCYY